MGKIRKRDIDPKERMKYLDLLWTSIAELTSRDQVKNFFKDLLSETEAIMLARRILIAKKLLESKTYEEIEREMKTSKTTIATVHRWLEAGFGGYTDAVKAFERAVDKRFLKARRQRIPAAMTEFEYLRQRYPLHFLLFNLLNKGERRQKKS